jgi:hypothetical protein
VLSSHQTRGGTEDRKRRTVPASTKRLIEYAAA